MGFGDRAASGADLDEFDGGDIERQAAVAAIVDAVDLECGRYCRLAVIDGTEERVRLIGIDTPETKKPDTPVQCFGPEASDFTKGLLPKGTPVLLVRDIEARDKYDRLLAYVYRTSDGVFVNLSIMRNGYARLLTIPPNVAHVDEFVAAAKAARTAGWRHRARRSASRTKLGADGDGWPAKR